MKKFFDSIKKLSLPLVLAIAFCVGGLVAFKNSDNFLNASAVFQTKNELSNNLPEYVTFDSTTENDAYRLSNVGDTIYLFQNESHNDVIIGNQKIVRDTISVGGIEKTETNYYYQPSQSNDQVYYYFDFTSSLSLYYNLTTRDLENGEIGDNLLRSQSISNYISSVNSDTEISFIPQNTSFTPKQFNLSFKLNTLQEAISFDGNVVNLKNEGIYTLVIPVIEYYTTNGGITFTSTTRDIYYNFMIFNANTYFDVVTGKPRISNSSNVQEAMLTASSAFSTYYYYNFSSADMIDTLPSISFDPNKFALSVEYTDLELNSQLIFIEYQNEKLVALDEQGNELSEEDNFLALDINTQNANSASIAFSKIGSYDMHFSYLYTVNKNGQNLVYNLDFDNLSSNSVFRNKSQRMYVYGYATMYSDYANIDTLTNQPKNVDLKTYDTFNHYVNSADITSKVNNYAKDKNYSFSNDLRSSNPSNANPFDIVDLKEATEAAIKSLSIVPTSTNQTPIKFLTNTRNTPYSKFYKVTNNEGVVKLDEGVDFQGFNQNDPGTYVYIIQYQFDSFMSTSGTLQSALYHYQIFYFTVTNTFPTVSVLDGNFNEVYTNGFTNKNVYILNDAENNIYDAKVDITLSAQNYETKAYYFQDISIKELDAYGIHYQNFIKSTDEVGDKLYNDKVGGKSGVLIENTNRYANAKFTIKITSANTDKAGSRTFTIDTNEIKNITSRNVSLVSSTTYRIGDTFSSYNTNQPMIFSWDEKASGARTYGYVSYIPTEAINYYSSQDSDNLSDLLSRLNASDILPVSYKIDLASKSQWTEYSNSLSFNSLIQSTYVKTNDGFYILEVYDQAGNSSFNIFLIDKSSPLFIQEISSPTGVSRSIFSNSDCISVPETGVDISIKWLSNKAIKLENITSILSLQSYPYSYDVNNANEKLGTLLNDFFKLENNDNITTLSEITVNVQTGSNTVSTGISSYNGEYLVMPINSRAYIKEGDSPTFKPFDTTEYQIKFFDENGNLVADNTTFKILVRDSSNTQNAGDESLAYRNYPSGHLSFNVTSDASKLMVLAKNSSGEYESLDFSTYSLSGNLYSFDNDGVINYTHLSGDESYTLTDKMYKFSYYTPSNSARELYLNYIPVAENGSVLESVILYYYPYERKVQRYDGDKNYYYYYDLKDTYTQKINIFTHSDKIYETGAEELFEIAIGSDSLPLAGKYVIERIYRDDSTTNQYDFFKRTLSIIIDNKNLITPLEAVTDENNNASLESVVGGDIVLSMYSGDNNASIEVSFPSYNENGLSTGSFYTKENFSENDSISSFSVSSNKLPLSLYIPQYKYTVASRKSVNISNGAEYNVVKNDNLSYYGNAYYTFNSETNLYDVYVEGTLVDSFGREQQAIDYLSTTEIKEYQLLVEVRATVYENNREVTKYYYSNGTTTNGYLRLYEASGKFGAISNNELQYFYQRGNYVVTMYQASNIGTTSSFYLLYKFGFEIISQAPDFDVIGADGYNLTATNQPNIYYTNSDSLKVQWEVPKSEYIAKIDENNITIRSYPSGLFTRSEIIDETTSKYFTIDTSALLNANNSYIEITMQYEGYNRNYYSTITKRIYFDKSMPIQNLQSLMTLTEQATNAFTTNYQLMYMREYYDYNNEEVTLSSISELSNISYSYSLSSGYFRYYSYNVTSDFFTSTLTRTIAQATNNPYDTQFIYYREVTNLNTYMQVDKTSFSAGNYYYISTNETILVNCGYYEIVEMDYAGNMVVYLVQVTSSNRANDPATENTALTYSNLQTGENIEISNDEITNGYNIYSTSGFEIKSFNYKSDDWAYFTVRLAGESEVNYMKSPWLDDSQVYRLSYSTSGINFRQTSLASIFEEIQSSANKHMMTLTNRIEGSSLPIYISIMDASLSTQKVEDPTKTSAILNISIPTPAEVESTTTSYIFPQHITIYQFDNNLTGENKWRTIMIADQNSYGTWTPTAEFSSALSYISFRTLAGNRTLQLTINLGANSSQKVKYEIVDNFGTVTTVIQLANEVSYREISGNKTIHSLTENDGSITYLSSDKINFSYNVLLYNISVFDRDGIEVTEEIYSTINSSTNIRTLEFNPTKDAFFDDYYKIIVKDLEEDTEIKTLHVRLYNKLPFRTNISSEVQDGGIIFNDKNQQPIDEKNIGQIPNASVNFNGKNYYATADYITTFSYNVTLRFYNGQSLGFEGRNHYQDGYAFSVYLSSDNGQTWVNINSVNSDTNGYTITGVGEYIVLVKYDNEDVFTDMCKLFFLSILDSSSSYYYITVDGLNIDKSDVKYTSLAGNTYEINYIVSVDYQDKNNRLKITTNEDLNVALSLITVDSTGSNVTVEIYRYECTESVGEFTIIYIAETNNIISTFTYETSTGTTTSIKDLSSVIIVANRETEPNFDKLRINFSSSYGIDSNKINIEVTKLFDGTYKTIYSPVYSDGVDSYIYLPEPGSYRLRVYDSCSPANVQTFNGSRFIDVIFLSSVPFTVTSTNENGENITTEPIQKAIFNGNVVIRPTYLSSYYQASRMPSISVKRNGTEYTGYTLSNNTYTFTASGYYSIIFNATSITGIPVRTEEYFFTIINQNESRYAFEFTEFDKYYIEKVEKNGVDITDDLVSIGNFSSITVDGKKYITNLTLNYLDEKTGGGRYKITINPNNNEMKNTIGENFTFSLWINMATPPISVSIGEGEKTTKNIVITFNVQNLYQAVGDCYLQIGTTIRQYNRSNINSYGTNENITILNTGTYYIQIYTASGQLLYSYKVIKSEPLNAFAIIAIVVGVIAAGAIVGITIALRKRQKIK